MVQTTEIEVSLAQKLNPRRFPGMSGKMAAIVAHVLGKHWSEPEIAELVISSDGFVLARQDGDVGCNDFIGPVQDLVRNVSNLVEVAGLTPEEKHLWDSRYRARITNWQP